MTKPTTFVTLRIRTSGYILNPSDVQEILEDAIRYRIRGEIAETTRPLTEADVEIDIVQIVQGGSP